MYGYLHLSSEMIQLSAMYIKPQKCIQPRQTVNGSWRVSRDKSIIIIIIAISTNKGKGNIIIPFLEG